MKGKQRTEIVQHPGLMAVEARDFQNEDRKKNGKRVVDWLDGSDPTYKRKLAVFQASDNPAGTAKAGHGIQGIGSISAYFKMQKINLESLRQCFLDPDVRIRQDFEFRPRQYARISKVTVSDGFLNGQAVAFNEGLNSIIGGKGTGKSLLIELMRFALDQSPNLSDIRDDHDRKLEHRLGKGGFVEIEFIDDSGTSICPRRTFDPVDSKFDSPEVDYSKLCRVLFLSQNEIIRIAEDTRAQLRFIDQFFDFTYYTEQIKSIEKSLRLSHPQLVESISAFSSLLELKRQVSTSEIEVTRLEGQLSDPIFEEYQLAEQKSFSVQQHIEEMGNIKLSLDKAHGSIASADETNLPMELAEDLLLVRIRNTLIVQELPCCRNSPV